MKIVLADDHPAVRDGLRWMLADESDIDIVGEAGTGEELLGLVETVGPDVVLLDINMPAMSGIDVLEVFADRPDSPRVLVLSMHDGMPYVRRAIELGAAGYVLKNVGREELIRALHIVAAGGSYLQGELSGALIREFAVPSAARESLRLTDRERDVLRLVAAGMDNRSIAGELSISEETVKSYLKTAFERLDVHTRAEAVAVALRSGLID